MTGSEFRCDVCVIQRIKIETAHQGRLAHGTQTRGLFLIGISQTLDDLVAAPAMFGVGDNMQTEEENFVVREAVFLGQRWCSALVNLRHLTLEPHQQPGDRHVCRFKDCTVHHDCKPSSPAINSPFFCAS